MKKIHLHERAYLFAESEHMTTYRVTRLFISPSFITWPRLKISEDQVRDGGVEIMRTAYALCDYIYEKHEILDPHDDHIFAWFLYMSSIYVHNWASDRPYDLTSFANWMNMDARDFILQFVAFCDVVFKLPPSPLTMRHEGARIGNLETGDRFNGKLISVYPFQIK